MNTNTKTSRLATVTLMAIVLLLCCVGCKAATGSQIGDKATDFSLPTLTGENVHLRDLEGKPVMFTFWTTGCGACIYQMQFVQEARDELKDKVTFIEIDIAQDSYTVKQCLDYYGFNVSVALDNDATTAIAYNIRYTPTNVIIDSKGVIQQIKIGAFTSTEQILTLLSDIK
jgi:peroxiredoxin